MAGLPLDLRTIQLTGANANVVAARSPLSALLTRSPVTISTEATLADAVAAMEAAEVSALLVEPGGIVTERDLVRALGRGVSVDERVGAVASPHPVVVSGALTVVEACSMMLNEQIRHLVVDVGGELAVVSLRDVAAVLLQSADPLP